MSPEGQNAFIDSIAEANGSVINIFSWRDVVTQFYEPYADGSVTPENPGIQAIFEILNRSIAENYTEYGELCDESACPDFAVRTCNSYWNPQVPIRVTNVDPFYLGMSSQPAEREDFIITPDLRGKVSCIQFMCSYSSC